jgi:hypothetical protein
MVRPACIVLVALASGCVDTSKCHAPVAWKPCAGDVAEPGASGSPPTIVELSTPACAYLDSPTVMGSLHVSDPDGDAQMIRAALYTSGMHSNEADIELDDAGRNGDEWTGQFTLAITGASGGMPMEGTSDVRIKVTDRAGAQSVSYCNSVAIVR